MHAAPRPVPSPSPAARPAGRLAARPAGRRRRLAPTPIARVGKGARTVAVLVLAVAMALILGACGSDGSTDAGSGRSTEHHHEVDGTIADSQAGVVAVTLTDHTFAADDAQVAAGAVSFRVTNQGAVDHQMMIGRLHAGVDQAAFVQTYKDQGEPAAFQLLDWEGGANGIAPGATEEATSQLVPGDYLMVCFMRGADGQSHVMKNMVAPLTVVEGALAKVAPPAGEVITVRDYAIEIPAGFRGDGSVSIRNEGHEAHEVALLRLADGKAVGDAFAWYGKPEGPPPFTAAGGIGVVSPGVPAWASLHLEPGNYVAVCFVPGPDGAPHALKGMVTPFTVS
ncbi:MAG: hypothetical protein ACXWCM_09720 [Acidimicrobiales bacterium]